MYYELYIDVFFLVNFMMDYLMLLVTRKMLKCSATHGNVCVGALAGAFLTCVVVILPVPYAFVKFMLFHLAVNTCMIKLGLKVSHIREFARAFCLLYVSGFLLGGVFTFLHQYVRAWSLFFALAIASYYLVQGIWKLMVLTQRIRQFDCEVTLYLGENSYPMHAVIDTGNTLLDPLSGKPVSVVSREIFPESVLSEHTGQMREVPYRAVGTDAGVIPVLTFDRMRICWEQDFWVEHPVIALAKESLSAAGRYEMILNPELF